MRASVTGLLAVTLVVAGCATIRDSRLNPGNWFGPSREVVVTEPDGNPLIPRRSALSRPEQAYEGRPIDRITDLTIEPLPGGAVLRASGVAARQGPYAVQLTPVEEASTDEVLVFTFDRLLPGRNTPVGPERTRVAEVATRLSDLDLEGVRMIRVEAARNARELRR
ncbi:MAG: hypothetical protein ACLFTP_03745 [Rhodosalinus sp.]|uniref:hypothetical protein n=1 Tax=Rhodosalinus sp. TaxID=2047741 RepID=UPI00397C79D0